MKRIPWHEQEPGHFGVDLAHHCGRTASGDYVHTIQMIDVATGWSERRAVLGRSYLVVRDAFNQILAYLLFPVREIHTDNGAEFFTNHMLRFACRSGPGEAGDPLLIAADHPQAAGALSDRIPKVAARAGILTKPHFCLSSR